MPTRLHNAPILFTAIESALRLLFLYTCNSQPTHCIVTSMKCDIYRLDGAVKRYIWPGQKTKGTEWLICRIYSMIQKYFNHAGILTVPKCSLKVVTWDQVLLPHAWLCSILLLLWSSQLLLLWDPCWGTIPQPRKQLF